MLNRIGWLFGWILIGILSATFYVWDTIRKFWRWLIGMTLLEAMICILFPVALVSAIIALYKHEQEWQKYIVENDCKVISKESDTIIPMTAVGSNGQISTTIIAQEGKTGWKCKDGITYYR